VLRGAERCEISRVGHGQVSALLDLKFPKVDTAMLEEFEVVRRALEDKDKKPAVVKKAVVKKAGAKS
jgi:hypothetical protein